MSIGYTFSESGVFEITNIGNISMYPEIELFGNMDNVSIHNDTAESPYGDVTFQDTVEIVEGDRYIINTKNRTIIDSVGANKLSELDTTSGWLKVYPGHNHISIGGQTEFTGLESKIRMKFRDAWI